MTGTDGTGLTRMLADFAASLRYEDLPPSTSRYAALLLADTVGAGLHGSTTEVGRIVWEVATASAASGRAAVWGRAGRLAGEAAALVNGTQAHAYELDDYHPGAKLHPGSVVVPAAMAAAAQSPRPVHGRELVTALVAGYDVMIRVSLAASSHAVRRRGWHLTGLAGPLGSAAAAARVCGLDAATTLRALGIAASHSGGLFAFSREGAMTKRLHAGNAARAGLTATALAEAGFTAPSDVLEAADGGLLRAASDEADQARGGAGLGEVFLLDEVAVKPYPCCGSLHSSVDAAIELATAHDLHPDDVAEVVAFNSRLVDLQCGFPYTGQGGELEAQMSLQYCVAVALADRQCGTAQFSSQRREDPAVRDLASRVRFEVDPEIDRIYPASFPARVRITRSDGSRAETRVSAPTGSSEAPFDWEGMSRKFHGTTQAVLSPPEADALLDLLAAIEDVADVRDLGTLV